MKDEISRALAACNAAHDKTSSVSAYHALLWSVGNNHAGTYTSSVLDLLPLAFEVLDRGEDWPKRTALETLIDLFGSFEPEPEGSLHEGTDLQSIVRQRITSRQASIDAIAMSSGVASASAQELSELIRETAA